MATLDTRRLVSLAAACRKAGITRLRLSDGTEFDLGPTAGPPSNQHPSPEVGEDLPPPPITLGPPPSGAEVGSTEWLLARFGKRGRN